ncbi:MAG: PH domain-containing protein, partial [Anaerolineae bacterium]|nr:PH domain-containing protein [Anaerolineae bacterium]
MEYRASCYRNGLVALAIVCVLLIVTGTLIVYIIRQPFSVSTFGLSIGVLICLVVLGMVSYWAVATLGLRYRIDRNGLRIWWGGSEWRVPIDHIQAITWAKKLDDEILQELRQRRTWLGGWTRWKSLHDGRAVVWRSNTSWENSLAVLTATHIYIISPE